MASIYDVDISEHITKVAEALKKVEPITPPAWSGFVKTGVHKERPPADKNWWYMRSASILRTVSKQGPIGVSKLRVKYGGRKSRGHKPDHFFKGSGNIIRKVLQQLEKAELVKQDEKNYHKGRVVTPKGRSFLDKIATTLRGPRTAKPSKAKKEMSETQSVSEHAQKSKISDTPKQKEQAAPKEDKKREVKKEAAAPKPKEQATPKPAEPKQEVPKQQANPKEEPKNPEPETKETTEAKPEPQKEQ